MQIDARTEGLLVQAVRRVAAREILPGFRALAPGDIDTKAGPDDLVTAFDRRAEQALAAEMAQILPDALFVGEESVDADPGLLDRLAAAELAVIVDPIDGTGNYAAGLAVFGVILAVVAGGETVFGLLYDPVIDDWVLARKGGGAWFAGPGKPPRRLTGRAPRPREAAQGYVPLFLYEGARRQAVAAALLALGRVNSLRCSCHEYRQLALGQADFVVSPKAKPWDHAAGCLVIGEAGGKVLSGGRPGYDPRAPKVPVVAFAHTDSADELLPDVLLTP
ncbi:MAG: inositol monophosphatase [Paracoccaceae bacterium]